MIRNKTLILSLLVLSACCKQSGEDEQQKGYYSQSLFDPYIAQGSIFTREVKNMPLAKNSAAIAAYMPKCPQNICLKDLKKHW